MQEVTGLAGEQLSKTKLNTMKIIASTGDETVLVSMTKDEFSKVAGFHSSYCLREEGKIDAKIGATMEVGVLYANAVELINWYREYKKEFVSFNQRTVKMLEIVDPSQAAKIK